MQIPHEVVYWGIRIATATGALALLGYLIIEGIPLAWRRVSHALSCREVRQTYNLAVLPDLIRLTERVQGPLLELNASDYGVELRMRLPEAPERNGWAWQVRWGGNCPLHWGDGVKKFVFFGPTYDAVSMNDLLGSKAIAEQATYSGAKWAGRALLGQVARCALSSEAAVFLLTEGRRIEELYDSPDLRKAYEELKGARLILDSRKAKQAENRNILSKFIAVPASTYDETDRQLAADLITDATEALNGKDEADIACQVENVKRLSARVALVSSFSPSSHKPGPDTV